MSYVWSGEYQLRSGTNLELDQASKPRVGEGAAQEIWLDNYGDSGHLVYTEGALAPWDIEREPTPHQCRRALDIGGTTQLRLTFDDQGKGICLRTSEGDRYAYFGLSTIDRSGIDGEMVVWALNR